MSASTLAPRVVSVTPDSPAAAVGLRAGDAIVRVNGRVPRDVIEWRLWTDEADVTLDVQRSGLDLELDVRKAEGQPLGAEVSSAVFDRVRTCDNHCEFCFIYQLPKGLRRSLYLKDDDYRLSFLYGNFTTLTRFTEADLERVVSERLSPLHVSIHTTDPALRARMLRNERGATSLRWLRALLDHGIDVRGQVVVCPGVNDGTAARRHAGRRTRRVPGAVGAGGGPTRGLALQPGAGDAAAYAGGGRRRHRRRRGLAGGLRRCARAPPRPRRRRVLPACRAPVPSGRALRGVHDARGRHRHGPHLRARVRGPVRRRDGTAARLLRRRRRRIAAPQPRRLHGPAVVYHVGARRDATEPAGARGDPDR